MHLVAPHGRRSQKRERRSLRRRSFLGARFGRSHADASVRPWRPGSAGVRGGTGLESHCIVSAPITVQVGMPFRSQFGSRPRWGSKSAQPEAFATAPPSAPRVFLLGQGSRSGLVLAARKHCGLYHRHPDIAGREGNSLAAHALDSGMNSPQQGGRIAERVEGCAGRSTTRTISEPPRPRIAHRTCRKLEDRSDVRQRDGSGFDCRHGGKEDCAPGPEARPEQSGRREVLRAERFGQMHGGTQRVGTANAARTSDHRLPDGADTGVKGCVRESTGPTESAQFWDHAQAHLPSTFVDRRVHPGRG